MNWNYNDGGRKASGFKGHTRDCAVRAIAIAAEKPYKEVYDDLYRVANRSPRLGVAKEHCRVYLRNLGFKWTPTMQIGSGCKVHLIARELPHGRIVCQLSRHLVALVDGVIQDTYDCSRKGTRCVYGYYEIEN